MTSRKGKSSKKANPMSGDTARRIWLAGIGAYGKAFSEAQETLSKVSGGTSKVFDELVQKGEVIETMVSIKGKDIAQDVMEKTGAGAIDDRIEKMRAKLRRTESGGTEELEDRMEALEAKLDKILILLEPKKPATKRKPAAKKTTAKSKK
jgi:polyhydroxyalkanoate synthesis regulator phasin